MSGDRVLKAIRAASLVVIAALAFALGGFEESWLGQSAADAWHAYDNERGSDVEAAEAWSWAWSDPDFHAMGRTAHGLIYPEVASGAATTSTYDYDEPSTTAEDNAPPAGAALDRPRVRTVAASRAGGHQYDDASNLERTSARPGDGVLAPNTARALPQELAVGRNAQSGVHVYHGVDAGKPVYAGITDDIARRQLQHGDRFVLDQLTPAAGVTRGQARAIEEALIVRNPGFQNLRHEISPRHSWYQDALDWGNDWLTGQGL